VASVLESGKPAAKSEGVRFLRRENAVAVFEVGSGTYDFTASP
jgi:alpha-L-rhamnosidase